MYINMVNLFYSITDQSLLSETNWQIMFVFKSSIKNIFTVFFEIYLIFQLQLTCTIMLVSGVQHSD